MSAMNTLSSSLRVAGRSLAAAVSPAAFAEGIVGRVRLHVLLFAFSACLMASAGPVKVGNPGFPYSVPGSFLTVCRCEKGKYMFNTYPGLWIRNVSTCWRENFCRLVPSVGGKDVEVTECVMRVWNSSTPQYLSVSARRTSCMRRLAKFFDAARRQTASMTFGTAGMSIIVQAGLRR